MGLHDLSREKEWMENTVYQHAKCMPDADRADSTRCRSAIVRICNMLLQQPLRKRNDTSRRKRENRLSSRISPKTAMARFLFISSGMAALAVTMWNKIVSPVFDAAATLLIVNDDGGRETITMAAMPLPRILEMLHAKKADTLICGAISTVSLHTLREGGIAVIPWIRGPVDEVIRAYEDGNLSTACCFSMPGCRRGQGHGNHARRRRRCARRNPGYQKGAAS
jgi:predicted Fe-Mo cluster-binding NifX family protein